MFCSSDKLHEKVVPLFLRADQEYISGKNLKNDMSKVQEAWINTSENIKKEGTRNFAEFPLEFEGSITCQIWDKFCIGWREGKKRPKQEMTIKDREEHMNALKPMLDIIRTFTDNKK